MKDKIVLKTSCEIFDEHRELMKDYYTFEQAPWIGTDYLPTDQDMLHEFMGFEAICIYTDPLSESVIHQLARGGLKIIGIGRATPNNIQYKAAYEENIPIVYTPGRNAYAVAEYTIGLMLTTCKRIAFTYHALQTGRFLAGTKDIYDVPDRKDVIWRFPDRENPRSSFPWSIDVFGRTVGIVGCGRIGAHVAKICVAMGMKVLVYDPFKPAEEIEKLGGKKVDDVMKMLPKCHFVTLHMNTTPETKGMVDAKWFDAMRPDAYFINTARAVLVNQKDLIDALEQKKIAYAALDVMWDEPAPKNHPLLHMDNVVVTPHMAGICLDPKKWASQMLAEDYVHYARNEPLTRVWKK